MKLRSFLLPAILLLAAVVAGGATSAMPPTPAGECDADKLVLFVEEALLLADDPRAVEVGARLTGRLLPLLDTGGSIEGCHPFLPGATYTVVVRPGTLTGPFLLAVSDETAWGSDRRYRQVIVVAVNNELLKRRVAEGIITEEEAVLHESVHIGQKMLVLAHLATRLPGECAAVAYAWVEQQARREDLYEPLAYAAQYDYRRRHGWARAESLQRAFDACYPSGALITDPAAYTCWKSAVLSLLAKSGVRP